MPAGVSRLPDEQLGLRRRAYDGAVAQRRNATLGMLATLAALTLLFGWIAGVDLARLWANAHRFPEYIVRLFFLDDGRMVLADVGEWFWGAGRWTRQLVETLLIAYVGTVLGAVGGFVLCFLAARNLGAPTWVRLLAKRWLEFCRTVPEIVFALIFVAAFGLGPLPGVLAIAIHTGGALGKMFADVVENADMRPFEGTAAAGATWVESIRFAMVPQVLSNFASYALLRFEINVRGAAVMGFVGAGGIGQDLLEAIRKFFYSDVSAILVMIIATVMIIDAVTERIRHGLLARENAR